MDDRYLDEDENKGIQVGCLVSIAGLLIIGMLIAIFLGGCSTAKIGTTQKDVSSVTADVATIQYSDCLACYVRRVIDWEAETVCYMVGSTGGIDCLPLEDTNLNTWGGN